MSRVIVISQSVSGGLYAAAKFDAQIASTIEGVSVELWAPGAQDAVGGGIETRTISVPASARRLRQLVGARKHIRSALGQSDTVHAHGLRTFLLAFPRRRLIATFHGAYSLRSSSVSAIVRSLALSVVPLFCASAWTVVPLSATGWKVAWYPRGGRDQDRPRTAGAELPRLLWLGRISPQKNFQLFLELVSLASAQGLISGAAVAGEFDPDHRHLATRAAELGVELLGNVAEVDALLQQDWIVCLFSHFEGRPFAVEEALDAALPVIVSDLPGNRMMIDEDRWLIANATDGISALRGLQTPVARTSVGMRLRSHLDLARSSYNYADDIRAEYAALATGRAI